MLFRDQGNTTRKLVRNQAYFLWSAVIHHRYAISVESGAVQRGLEQFLDRFTLIKQRHGPSVRMGERGVRIDAQMAIHGGQHVFGT